MSILSGLLGMVPVVGPLLSGMSGGGQKPQQQKNTDGVDWGSLVGDVGRVAGGAGASAAAARQLDARNVLAQNDQANQQYSTHQGAEMNAGGLDLQRKGFEESARGGRAKQALIASLLGGGFQPTSINVPGVKQSTISGGLAESLKNPGTQQSMQELMKQALAEQMQQGSPEGEQFSGGKVFAPPPMTALPKAGAMENVMGATGLGGSFLASVLKNLSLDGAQK